MKLAVFCVLAVSVAGLSAILVNGCKKEQSTENLPLPETNNFAADTNNPPPVATNPPVVLPPVATNPPVITPLVPETAGTEYVIVKGDTLAKIAKAHGVTLKTLQAANLNVQPTKLKIGQKITIPAGGAAAPAATATGTETTAASTGSSEAYVVKSGDTLTKIAKAHGTTVKLIQSENNLSTTKIKVGQKLKIPAKAEAAAPAPAPAPVAALAPVAAAPVAPVAAPAPAGTQN